MERYVDFHVLGTPFESGTAVWKTRQTYADGLVKPWTGPPEKPGEEAPESGPTDPGPAATVTILEPGQAASGAAARRRVRARRRELGRRDLARRDRHRDLRPVPAGAGLPVVHPPGPPAPGRRGLVTTARRTRLHPATFQLPVEKMRDGYYSDAYFTFTRDVLELDDHRPDVLMQVFQRERSVLGGVDEALAILRLCSGQAPGGRHLGGRLGAPGGERALRRRRGRPLGDGPHDPRRLQPVRPPRDALPRRAGAAHAHQPQRARRGGGGRRQADPLLPRPLRPLAGADRGRLGGAHRRRDRRLHRRPGLLVGRQGHGHRPPRADRRLRRRHRARRAHASPTASRTS